MIIILIKHSKCACKYLNKFIIHVITSIYHLICGILDQFQYYDHTGYKKYSKKLSYEWNVWINVWNVLDKNFSNSQA